MKRVLILIIGILYAIQVGGIVVPPSYGKTQFIIGVTEQELKAQDQPHPQTQSLLKVRPLSLTDLAEGRSIYVFFSPDDNVTDLLLSLIDNERTNILMAAYMITNKKIVKKLIEAHTRGVRVEVIADTCCLQSTAGGISHLAAHGIPSYIYHGVTPSPTLSNIMHHKFIIFGNNIGHKTLVWTGSFNFTHSAQRYNQENIIILSDSYVTTQFKDHFEVLKNRCIKHCVADAERVAAKKTKRNGQNKKKALVTYATESQSKKSVNT